MKSKALSDEASWKIITFLSLTFLLFLQMVSDFIESVYTFGLLGTDIPPEMVSIVLFFAPAVLLAFKRKPSLRAGLILVGLAALLRALQVSLPPGGKMLAGGIGVGLLLIFFSILLAHLKREGAWNGLAAGAGLTTALALSILLRSLGAGSDITVLFPVLGWLNGALVLGAVALVIPLASQPDPVEEAPRAGFWSTAALSIGFLSAMLVLYYAFASPGVLARWSGVDVRLILLTLGIAVCLFFALLTGGRIQRISGKALWLGNGLFLISGTAAILINQTPFPAESAAFPLYQATVPWIGQIPLMLMILLSPVVLIDFTLLAGQIAAQQPSIRQLAGGFTLAAFLFLLIVLAQVFTTVYDYIPVIGPWFRDRFWLVFLAAGLSLALPLLAVRELKFPKVTAPLYALFFPIVLTCLLSAVVIAVVREPEPAAPTQAGSLRVLTYNLQQGYDPRGQRAYLEQLEVIRNEQPDIVGLQETDVARFSGGNADLVRTIAEGLNMYAYYGPKTVNGTFGIALLSRIPLENPQTFYMYSEGEQTAAITAEVTVDGVKYHVLVTHLGNGGPLIQQQQVLEELQGQTNVIAMGDFNFRPDTEQYALTTKTLDDAWVLVGQPVAPGLDTTDLIDHLFVTPGMQVKSAEYIVSPVSDHPGLVVEILP